MIRDDALRNMPSEGLVKITRGPSPPLTGQQRTALIRKGNELFNAGRIEEAKRVFLTARYGDGLGRVGDHYLGHEDPLEALRMYWLAPAPDKVQMLIEKFSFVVKSWLQEEEGTNEERGTP